VRDCLPNCEISESVSEKVIHSVVQQIKMSQTKLTVNGELISARKHNCDCILDDGVY